MKYRVVVSLNLINRPLASPLLNPLNLLFSGLASKIVERLWSCDNFFLTKIFLHGI